MTNRGGEFDKRHTGKTADEGTTGQKRHNDEANSNNMNKNNERTGQGHTSAAYSTGQRSYSSKAPTSY